MKDMYYKKNFEINLFALFRLLAFSLFFSFLFFSPTIKLISEEITEPNFDFTLYEDVFTPENLPHSSFSKKILANIQKEKANLGAEVSATFTLSQTTLFEDEKDMLLLHTLFQLQTLEGIQYYSYKRKQYRTFIIDSYRVESIDKKDMLSDISIFKTSPKQIDDDTVAYNLYWFRKDSSFGSGVLQYTVFYNAQEHEAYVQIINLEHIQYYGVLTIALPKTMTLHALIKREKDTYSMYMLAGVRTKSGIFKAMRKRVAISLAHRLYAISKWFENTAPKMISVISR